MMGRVAAGRRSVTEISAVPRKIGGGAVPVEAALGRAFPRAKTEAERNGRAERTSDLNEPSPDPTTHQRGERLALLGWLLVAGLVRGLCLGEWSLWGDEAYSHIHAGELWTEEASPSLKVYPLFFVLEWLCLQFPGAHESLELSLRAVPALAGALAVGVLFAGSRRFLDGLTRHLLAALATFSPWLIYHSQFARFYSLLLLLSAVAAFQFYAAVQQNSRRLMIQSMIWFALAIATHPTAVLLLGSCAAFALASKWRGCDLSWRTLSPLGVLFALGAVLALIKLQSVSETVGFRFFMQDAGADSVPALIQGIAYNLGLSISALAALGAWRLLGRDQSLAAFLWMGAGLPIALVLGLAAIQVPVEQRYLIPVVPLLLVLAAMALAELVTLATQKLRVARWFVPVLALSPFAPAFASHYLDGNRHNLRGAAEWIEERLEEDDAVVAEIHYLFALYVPQLPEELLLEAPPQFGRGYDLYRAGLSEAKRVWVVIPTDFQGVSGDRGGFYDWVWEVGSLQQEFFAERWDYHENRLQVFLIEDIAAARTWRPEENRDEDAPERTPTLRSRERPTPQDRPARTDRPRRERPEGERRRRPPRSQED